MLASLACGKSAFSCFSATKESGCHHPEGTVAAGHLLFGSCSSSASCSSSPGRRPRPPVGVLHPPCHRSRSLELSTAAAPLASWVRNVVRSVTGQQATVPATANVALSTPWTAFAGGVNVVAGNVSLAQADLAIPSVGFATTVGRAYNSAAADLSGPFGYGWTWSYGVQSDRPGHQRRGRARGRPG